MDLSMCNPPTHMKPRRRAFLILAVCRHLQTLLSWWYIQKESTCVPSDHTCFVYGSLNGNGAQLCGWNFRQAPFEGAHWGADSTDDDHFLKQALKSYIWSSHESHTESLTEISRLTYIERRLSCVVSCEVRVSLKWQHTSLPFNKELLDTILS